jgi:hypothetical protein
LDGCLVSFGSNEFGECGRGDGNEDGMEGDATLEIRTENVMKNKDLKNKIDYERVKKRKKWLDWGFVVGFDGQKSGGSTVMNRTQGLLSGEGSGSSTPGGSNTPGSSIGSALVSSGGANRVVSYSCGAYHAVAVTQFGQVYTWGKNESGQLGIPLNGNTVSGMIQQTGGLSTGSVGGLKRSELVSSGGSLKRSELGEKGKGIKKSNEVLEFDLPPSFVDVPNEITNNVYISLINSNNSSYSSAVASRADLSLTAALVYTNTEHLYSRLEQETIQELEDEGKVVGAGGSLVYGKRKDIPFTVMELSNDMSSSAAVRSLLNRSASPSKTRFSVSPPPTSSSSSSSSASSASSAPVADPFNIALTSHPNGSYSRSNSVVSCGYGMTKKVSSYSYGVFGPYKIISAAAGVHHTLFLTSDGRIFVCGKNIVGQLGIPPRLLPSSSLYNPMLLPQVLFNNKKISCIYAGSFHSGCLTSQGELYTWGMNNNGQCTVSSNTITERKYGSMIPTAEGNVSCIPAPFNVSELIKKRKAKLNEKLRKKELKNKKKKAAKGIYEEEDDDLDIFGENLEVIILNIKALMDESDFIVDVGMSDFSTFILFSSGKVFCCGEGSNVENVINKENTLSLDHADEDVEATPKRDPLKSPEPNRRSQSPTKFASSLYFRPSSLPKPSLLLYKGSSLVDVSATIADTLNSEITLEEEEKDEEIEVEKVEFKTTKILGGRCYMGLLVI